MEEVSSEKKEPSIFFHPVFKFSSLSKIAKGKQRMAGGES